MVDDAGRIRTRRLTRKSLPPLGPLSLIKKTLYDRERSPNN